MDAGAPSPNARSHCSPQACIETCFGMDPALFPAITMGSMCDCIPYTAVEEITSLGEVDACDVPCSGDDTETCGGFLSFDLYAFRPVTEG